MESSIRRESERRGRRAKQPELGGHARQADLREEVSVDEEHGNRIAVTPGEIRIGIDVNDVPFVRPVPEEQVNFPAHLVAEVAAGARKERQADHTNSVAVWGVRATRRT